MSNTELSKWVEGLIQACMTLLADGFRQASSVEPLVKGARDAIGRLELAEQAVEVHQATRDRYPLDGTEGHRSLWWDAHRELVAARQNQRHQRMELEFIGEELEREWAHGTHLKAKHGAQVNA